MTVECSDIAMNEAQSSVGRKMRDWGEKGKAKNEK